MDLLLGGLRTAIILACKNGLPISVCDAISVTIICSEDVWPFTLKMMQCHFEVLAGKSRYRFSISLFTFARDTEYKCGLIELRIAFTVMRS